MNKSEISQILESLKIQPEDISDKTQAEAFRLLLQIIEILNEENQALKAELQKTRDELNQLKGEQGKPKFSVPKKKALDISSENERKSVSSSKRMVKCISGFQNQVAKQAFDF
ncbi:MAG: hypothetical protein ACT6FE_05270, partial [Methanosarcinaceae archaeon]